MQEEGVIKFDLQFRFAEPAPMNSLQELNTWRNILWKNGLIGQDPCRYGGYGFGNVSQRIGPFDAGCGKRVFVISGTQTGELEELDNSHYAIVSAYDTGRNHVIASGPVKPSSESLTHAAIYDLDDEVHAVLHVHSPDIWKTAAARNIPLTDPSVDYGTPAMAQEVRRLFNESDVRQIGIFAMGGHEDGVVSFGPNVEQAGHTLLHALTESRYPDRK
ncbi:MAG: class II aldolase/adducin family protein [Gammaproteobacteria bacterium]|nr:class II aldolase/adducin family protein [Gammaproteobacteria bacterium]